MHLTCVCAICINWLQNCVLTLVYCSEWGCCSKGIANDSIALIDVCQSISGSTTNTLIHGQVRTDDVRAGLALQRQPATWLVRRLLLNRGRALYPHAYETSVKYISQPPAKMLTALYPWRRHTGLSNVRSDLEQQQWHFLTNPLSYSTCLPITGVTLQPHLLIDPHLARVPHYQSQTSACPLLTSALRMRGATVGGEQVFG